MRQILFLMARKIGQIVRRGASTWLHGIRFGNLGPVVDAAVERYYLAGSFYDVSQTAGKLEVRRDGKFLFASDAPIEIQRVEFEKARVSFELRAPRPINLGGKCRDARVRRCCHTSRRIALASHTRCPSPGTNVY